MCRSSRSRPGRAAWAKPRSQCICPSSHPSGEAGLLIDTDPQRSLAWWHRLRGPEEPRLIEADARELPDLIAAARSEGFGRVIVDTPPHAEDSILGAMRSADLVLVPTRPGPSISRRSPRRWISRSASARRRSPSSITRQPGLGRLSPPSSRKRAQPSNTWGPRFAASVLANRVAMSHAILTGSTVNEHEPDGKAAAGLPGFGRKIEAALTAQRKAR